MASSLQIQGDESVLLRVTHSNIKSFSADVRFSLQMTVEAVKEKLWKKCGTSVNSMCLELYDDSGYKISDLSNNMRPLGSYSPFDGYRLHVIDLDPSSVTSGGWLEDTSLVEKYKISDEAYEKRDGTFRKFKEKIAHQNPLQDPKNSDKYMEELCTNIKTSEYQKLLQSRMKRIEEEEGPKMMQVTTIAGQRGFGEFSLRNSPRKSQDFAGAGGGSIGFQGLVHLHQS